MCEPGRAPWHLRSASHTQDPCELLNVAMSTEGLLLLHIHSHPALPLAWSLNEPTVWSNTFRAIVPLGRPRVMLVHDAVFLCPPIQRTHEDNEAEHPPHNSDFHAVELPKVINVSVRALRAPLLETIPQSQLHDLTILRTAHAGSAEDPVLRNWRAVLV